MVQNDVEVAVRAVGVPDGPVARPGASPELLVGAHSPRHLDLLVAPLRVAAGPVVRVTALGAAEVQQSVLPVAGLEEPEELDGEVPRPDGAQPGVGCLPEVGHGGVDIHAVKAVCTRK